MNKFYRDEIAYKHPVLRTGIHTMSFSFTCHVGKTYCKKVMEHFVHCVAVLASRCATWRVPDLPFLHLLLTRSVSAFPSLLTASPSQCLSD